MSPTAQVLTSLILAVIVLSPPALGGVKTLDAVAAVVNGSVITIHDLREKIIEVDSSKDKYREVLDRMIEDALVQAEITKRGLSASEAEIEQAVNQVKQQNDLRSNEQLLELLKSQDLTFSQFRANLKNQIERGKFVNYVMGTKIKIEDDDIRQYYEENYLRDNQAKKYTLRHIFLDGPRADKTKRQKAKDLANELRKKLAAKQDFSQLAKEMSDAPTAASGGLLGDFLATELQEEFLQAVVSLKAGEISQIVANDAGFYIFKVDKISSAPPPAFERIREDIRRKLNALELERHYRIWVSQMKQKAFIDVRIQSDDIL